MTKGWFFVDHFLRFLKREIFYILGKRWIYFLKRSGSGPGGRYGTPGIRRALILSQKGDRVQFHKKVTWSIIQYHTNKNYSKYLAIPALSLPSWPLVTFLWESVCCCCCCCCLLLWNNNNQWPEHTWLFLLCSLRPSSSLLHLHCNQWSPLQSMIVLHRNQ